MPTSSCMQTGLQVRFRSIPRLLSAVVALALQTLFVAVPAAATHEPDTPQATNRSVIDDSLGRRRGVGQEIPGRPQILVKAGQGTDLGRLDLRAALGLQLSKGKAETKTEVLQPVFQPAQFGRNAGKNRGFAKVFEQHGLARIHRLTLNSGDDLEAVAHRLTAMPEVEWAEPLLHYQVLSQHLERAQDLPNDPYLHSEDSWGHGLQDLWGLHRIRAPLAWQVADGSGVSVAVIDSGCDLAHADLVANLWRNSLEIEGNGIDDEGNGYVDDVLGWDFHGTLDPISQQLVDDNSPEDRHGHGTHVAGTLAATANNGLGIAGVAPGARLLCLQGLGAHGVGFSDNLAEAILYAASRGAQVINMSWGGQGYSQVIEEALTVAHDLGITLVAAAGNSASPTAEFYPASSRRVINVGAANPADELSYFSNSGSGLDLLAPGAGERNDSESGTYVNILSLRSSLHSRNPLFEVGDDYLRLLGTSMAAPHVAGAAALVLQHRPGLTGEAVRQVLRRTAISPHHPQWHSELGYGRLDAAAAVATDLNGSARILSPRPLTFKNDRIEVHGLATSAGFVDFVLDYGAGSQPQSWNLLTSASAPAKGMLAVWNTAQVLDGVYTLRLRLRDSSGGVFEDRVEVTLDRVSIVSPADDLPTFRLGDSIAVTGQAAGGGFDGFRVEFQDLAGEWRQDGITLTHDGRAPVAQGTLATWDSSVLSTLDSGELFAIRLVVERAGEEPIIEEITVIVDPNIRSGWPARLGQSTILGSFPLIFSDHLVAVDVDGDGSLEIPVAYGQEVRMLRHDGSSLPGWPQSTEGVYPDNPGFVQQSPVVVDLDADGKPEVLLPQAGGWVAAWHDNGEPVAGWPKELGRAIALVDLDGDQVFEIVATDHYSSARVHNLDGSDHLPRPLVSITGRSRLSRPAIGDLDGDGDPEIVFQISTDSGDFLRAFDHQGHELPGWPIAVGTGRNFYGAPVIGDVNGDGLGEVVAVDFVSCEVTVANAEGQVLPGWPRSPMSDARNCQSPTLGDLDGDGRLDVVLTGLALSSGEAGERADLLTAWRGDGTTVSGFPVLISGDRPDSPIFGFGSPALADVDGDQALEVVVAARTFLASDHRLRPKNLYVFENDGVIKTGFPSATSGGDPGSGQTPLVADLDGDGQPELAWANEHADVSVWNLTQDSEPVPNSDLSQSMPAAGSAQGWPMFRHDAALTGGVPSTMGRCEAGGRVLCLGLGRFVVSVTWRDFEGNEGAGQPVDLADDTGSFWFFAPDNLELMVKVLDGRAWNGHFWVFVAALSNVEYNLTITDTVTGRRRVYHNPAGELSSFADLQGFSSPSFSAPSSGPERLDSSVELGAPVDRRSNMAGSETACGAGDLCLQEGRFEVRVDWTDFADQSGQGQPRRLTRDTGAFWFFHEENLELLVKVVDGRQWNGRHWVFVGGLSNVEYRVTVIDKMTGKELIYHNPAGELSSFSDITAFADP